MRFFFCVAKYVLYSDSGKATLVPFAKCLFVVKVQSPAISAELFKMDLNILQCRYRQESRFL